MLGGLRKKSRVLEACPKMPILRQAPRITFKYMQEVDKMNTPSSHCPGFESYKNLQSFICKCQHCGAEKEIFSDEFSREHICKKCEQSIDFKQCEYSGGASDQTHR
jgi:hypothetical protein